MTYTCLQSSAAKFIGLMGQVDSDVSVLAR